MMTADIQIIDENTLLCPRCGSNYLSHKRVTVFDRLEDEDVSTVTTVDGGSVTSRRKENAVGNPSLRRHGILIAFECEGCSGTALLALAQHKGETLIQWRYE